MVKMEGESGGVIAGLALSSHKQARPLRPTTRVLTEKEREEKLEQMHRIVLHTFYNELRVGPDECSVLLTEPVFTDAKTRNEIVKWYFDDLEAKALMFVTQEFLALVSNGYQTGIVINMGYTYTSIVPIWNMNILRDKAVILPLGGQDVAKALELLLKQRRSNQIHHMTDFDPLVVEDIMRKTGYVAENYEQEMLLKGKELNKEYELPDCQVVKLGAEIFQCTEGYFQPHLLGIHNTPGLIESVNQLIDTLDQDIRKEIVEQSGSVFLSGSCSMFPGLKGRLQEGIREKRDNVKVVAAPERKMSAWIGGSIWATLSSTQTSWTTKEEYEKHGPSVVHSKCF